MSLIPSSFMPQMQELVTNYPDIISFQFLEKPERLMMINIDGKADAFPEFLPEPINAKVVILLDQKEESSLLSPKYNVGIGPNALCKLTTGSYNFVVGKNSGTAITTQSCNFIFGDDIPGEAKSDQFLIGELSDSTIAAVMEHFDELYQKLDKDYPLVKDGKNYSDEQLSIMKEKMRELKSRYVAI